MSKIVHISGKRWHQRLYGNTYHTATLHYADGTSETSPITYGYGHGYLQTAAEMLKASGKSMKGLKSHSVADVGCRRDL